MRKPNEKDLRSNHVFLTQLAKDFKPTLFSIIKGWTNILSTGMTEEEVEQAFILLTKLAQNAADYIHKDRF
ncbi:hypothetical protein N752_19460 [Desulforamulus aquiferis]|nr:hypothetical protein [Desulforamulus aquiferis]RYD03587.1 hypothetical protein N752_19460 [Desulforamulus aquiferis]